MSSRCIPAIDLLNFLVLEEFYNQLTEFEKPNADQITSLPYIRRSFLTVMPFHGNFVFEYVSKMFVGRRSHTLSVIFSGSLQLSFWLNDILTDDKLSSLPSGACNGTAVS